MAADEHGDDRSGTAGFEGHHPAQDAGGTPVRREQAERAFAVVDPGGHADGQAAPGDDQADEDHHVGHLLQLGDGAGVVGVDLGQGDGRAWSGQATSRAVRAVSIAAADPSVPTTMARTGSRGSCCRGDGGGGPDGVGQASTLPVELLLLRFPAMRDDLRAGWAAAEGGGVGRAGRTRPDRRPAFRSGLR